MRANRKEQPNDIDVANLGAVLRRSMMTLLLASACVGGLVYGALLLVPSHYTSTAQISLGAKSRDGLETAQMAALQLDREAIASRVQELRSPDLARRLATELRLNLRPEFNSALDSDGMLGVLKRLTGIGGPRPGETEEERVLAAYHRALEVYQVKETRVINLAFTARDPELSATAANRLIELYQQWLRQQGAAETTDANAWLAPEIAKRTREVSQSEAAVERFRSEANLFRGGSGTASGLADQQLTDMTAELTRARSQRGEAEARARAARDLIERGSPDAIPDVQKSPVIQGLIAQRAQAERDRAEAATQLLPAHPRMKQLNANVADVRRQVQREAATIVEGLEREAKVLALREELAQRTLDEAKARIGDTAGARVRLQGLEDEAAAKRRELQALRDRYESARSRSTTKPVPVEVQVIATATPTSRPSWPSRIPTASLAAAATFVLGLVLVLFRELLAGGSGPVRQDRGRTTGGAVSGRAEQAAAAAPSAAPSLGAHAVPIRSASVQSAPVQSTPVQATQVEVTPAAAGPAPAVPRLASAGKVVERLVGNSGGHSGYRSLVVGASDRVSVREAATDIAAGLAVAGRRVVLVDWSPDGTGIAAALGLAEAPGFTELLAGTHLFDDVIQALPDGEVDVVASGAPASEETLDPDRLNLLLDALDESYDDVVVTGAHAALCDLFVAIEGRFDAAVVVGEATGGAPAEEVLGFEVTEMDVVRLAAPVVRKGPRGPSRRPALAGGPPATAQPT